MVEQPRTPKGWWRAVKKLDFSVDSESMLSVESIDAQIEMAPNSNPKPKLSTTTPYIPPELVFDILLWLPPKDFM
ncbi:hypothetical protein ACE6H2_022566 [Prunus campanulata]